MAISISVADLLKYHSAHYPQSPRTEYITKYVLSNKQVTQDSSQESMADTIDINNLQVDPETLDKYLENNRGLILENSNVQQFIESQRIHRANFLSEIKTKGLTLKDSFEDKRMKASDQKFLNY